jgi:hypothetical protein
MEEYNKARQANQQAQESKRQGETTQLMRALRGQPGSEAPPDSLGGGPSMPAVNPDPNLANELLVNSNDPQLRALGMARLMPKEKEGYTLAEGGARFDGDNNQVASNVRPEDFNKAFGSDGTANTPYQEWEIKKSEAGANRSQVNVNTSEHFTNTVNKEAAQAMMKNHETLKDVPSLLNALDNAQAFLSKAGGFVGSNAETKLNVVKFLNNNLGFKIRPEAVANAEALRSSLFENVKESLKKMDASPSQRQQEMMQDAFGRLTTDPAALPLILDFYRQQASSRATDHNRRVDEITNNPAMGKHVFPYNIKVKVQPDIIKRSHGQAGGVKFLGFE